MPTTTCDNCNRTFEYRKRGSYVPRYCSRDCYREEWRRTGKDHFIQAGIARLAELHAAGADPRHGPEQQSSRSRKIAQSNRLKPRKRR